MWDESTEDVWERESLSEEKLQATGEFMPPPRPPSPKFPLTQLPPTSLLKTSQMIKKEHPGTLKREKKLISRRILSVGKQCRLLTSHKCDFVFCRYSSVCMGVYACLRVCSSLCWKDCVVDSWCLGTLCALLHNHQLKYQISGRELDTQKSDFFSYHDSLQNVRDGPARKFLGNGLESSLG